MQKFEKMPFNDVCVATIEALLERAKQGRISWLGYAVCEGPLSVDDAFVGDLQCFYSGHFGLQRCANRTMERLNHMAAPTTDLKGEPDSYCYEVSLEPICFDFIPWLINCKMIQAREGVKGPTRIHFLRNKSRDNFADPEYRSQFFETVMYPAIGLFGCVHDIEAGMKSRTVANYTYRPIVEAAEEGEEVPRIKVPTKTMEAMKEHLAGVEPVVITLREHRYYTHRNSGLTDWLRFAEYLQERGEHVIFVRDFAHADEEITGFDTFPAASRDLHVRAALYEHAKCNLFVSNGPATLAVFGSRPWLQFIVCDVSERNHYLQNTPDWWFLQHGIGPGQQFPWSAANQRIVWKPDTYENMVEAWEQTFPAMAEAAE